VAEVETDLDPGLPLVPCNPGELNQVILNIMINAAHAVAEKHPESDETKGTIRITTRQVDDAWAEIRIRDDGPGIREEVRDRVFDPFFTTKEVGKGTGQGLAICHAAVERHGGAIGFETALGEGTTFVVRLPLAPETDNRTDDPTETREPEAAHAG
jgi:signal transduction histidine kinase